MLRGLTGLTRLTKGASSPLFKILTHEDPSKLLMGVRKGSSATAYLQMQDHASRSKVEEHPEHYPIYKRAGPAKLHLNLKELPEKMQGSFVDLYLEELTNELKDNPYHTMSFNNVSEEVFRYHLNMPIRRLGYTSTFTRYNHGLGIATFEKRV